MAGLHRFWSTSFCTQQGFSGSSLLFMPQPFLQRPLVPVSEGDTLKSRSGCLLGSLFLGHTHTYIHAHNIHSYNYNWAGPHGAFPGQAFPHILCFSTSRKYLDNINSCCLVTQSCPTLCDPMDCSPSGSSANQTFYTLTPLKLPKILSSLSLHNS